MKKQRKYLGGDIYWGKEEEDTDIIRDREICRTLRKMGVLSISPIGEMHSRGVTWRLNVAKILEYGVIETQNG